VTSYIDAHLHFWDTGVARYQWLEDEPRLPDRVTLDDYREATADDPPERYIFIQADADPAYSIAETRWVHSMCSATPDFGGMVVWAPVDEGPDMVAAHLESLELPNVVGVRRIIQWGPLGLCTAPEFVQAVASLGSRDLAFDVCIFPHQLDDALTLARSTLNTRIVLDHLGKPDIARGDVAAWQKGFEALAALDNVWCKLSGLVTEAKLSRWTVEDLRPFVHIALGVFGPQRIIWGSDWPVCTISSSHQRWREATAELLGDLSAQEREQILVRNARKAYRLR
jgi:L-fuconolactonase